MNAESVKDRLRNVALRNGREYQDELIYYGLERAIYRLSISRYKENFILKGGIFLYALFDGEYSRITSDIDCLAENITNSPEEIKKIFSEIFQLQVDDGLRFELNSLEVHTITEFKKYHGVHTAIMAYLDKTQIPVSIDIGFGDVIVPKKTAIDFPVLLNMEVPRIYAYSKTTAIAEKFEAIVSLGMLNSRYKDFYDIYILACINTFEELDFANSIKETFAHRQTDIGNIAAFENDFINDPLHEKRWNSFVKKKKITEKVTLKEAIKKSKN